jgi:hypothetical protein
MRHMLETDNATAEGSDAADLLVGLPLHREASSAMASLLVWPTAHERHASLCRLFTR